MIVIPDDSVLSDTVNNRSGFEAPVEAVKPDDWVVLDSGSEAGEPKEKIPSSSEGSVIDLNVNIVNQPEEETLLFTKYVPQEFESDESKKQDEGLKEEKPVQETVEAPEVPREQIADEPKPKKERRMSEQTIEKEYQVQVNVATDKTPQKIHQQKSIDASEVQKTEPSPPSDFVDVAKEVVRESVLQIPEIRTPEIPEDIQKYAEEIANEVMQAAILSPYRDEFEIIEPAEPPPPSEDFDDTSDITTDIEMVSIDERFNPDVIQDSASVLLIFNNEQDQDESSIIVSTSRSYKLTAWVEFHDAEDPVSRTEDIHCKFEFTVGPEEAQVETTIRDQVSDDEVNADENSILSMSGASTAYSPPVFILTLPEERTLKSGDPAVFRCTFHGIPLPHATWYVNGVVLEKTSNVNLINEDGVTVLQVKQVPKKWEKCQLMCQIQNPAGQASCTCAVSIDGRLSSVCQTFNSKRCGLGHCSLLRYIQDYCIVPYSNFLDAEERLESISIQSVEPFEEVVAVVPSTIQRVSIVSLGTNTSDIAIADGFEADDGSISLSSTDTFGLSGRSPAFVADLPGELYIKVRIFVINW